MMGHTRLHRLPPLFKLFALRLIQHGLYRSIALIHDALGLCHRGFPRQSCAVVQSPHFGFSLFEDGLDLALLFGTQLEILSHVRQFTHGVMQTRRWRRGLAGLRKSCYGSGKQSAQN